MQRYEIVGSRADLDEATVLIEETLVATTQAGPDLPCRQSVLVSLLGAAGATISAARWSCTSRPCRALSAIHDDLGFLLIRPDDQRPRPPDAAGRVTKPNPGQGMRTGAVERNDELLCSHRLVEMLQQRLAAAGYTLLTADPGSARSTRWPAFRTPRTCWEGVRE